LRIMPNMSVWRPCDAVETIVAWRDALERVSGPTSLVLTRQGLPHQPRNDAQIADIRRGGYVLKDADGAPDLILIASGSEVALCMDAAAVLTSDGVAVRVVSVPNLGLFEQQDANYRESVLPADIRARVAVEAGVPDSWYRHVGDTGAIIAMQTFGASAPANELFEHFGFSVSNVVARAKALLN
jgi:transketolase